MLNGWKKSIYTIVHIYFNFVEKDQYFSCENEQKDSCSLWTHEMVEWGFSEITESCHAGAGMDSL